MRLPRAVSGECLAFATHLSGSASFGRQPRVWWESKLEIFRSIFGLFTRSLSPASSNEAELHNCDINSGRNKWLVVETYFLFFHHPSAGYEPFRVEKNAISSPCSVTSVPFSVSGSRASHRNHAARNRSGVTSSKNILSGKKCTDEGKVEVGRGAGR